jgi:hypothetical protein
MIEVSLELCWVREPAAVFLAHALPRDGWIMRWYATSTKKSHVKFLLFNSVPLRWQG